jgi:hypothetical protein
LGEVFLFLEVMRLEDWGIALADDVGNWPDNAKPGQWGIALLSNIQPIMWLSGFFIAVGHNGASSAIELLLTGCELWLSANST